MSKLDKVLHNFKPIHLDELGESKLMDRIETKFAFKRDKLEEVLNLLTEYYYVLTVGENRISKYQSLYFDKEKFDFYKDHHNQKNHRYKVRFRKYIDTEVNFLEVKEKKKGRTKKVRIPVDRVEEQLSEKEKAFISSQILNSENLEAKLWNQYERITLVSLNKKERLTLDLNLVFKWHDEVKSYDSIIIAELKQKKIDRSSAFYKVMRSKGIRPHRMSKYCIGTVELYSKRKIKYNRFKKKLLKLKKINNAN